MYVNRKHLHEQCNYAESETSNHPMRIIIVIGIDTYRACSMYIPVQFYEPDLQLESDHLESKKARQK